MPLMASAGYDVPPPMIHRDEYDEDDEADVGDHEDPSESDVDDDDESELIACPYCREEIAEEAEVCPHCGSYVVAEDVGRAAGRPWWVVAGMIACVLIVVTWILRYV